ncbi:ankyrin repeat domain-containing protein [Priestia flexa]|uniref:Ankyrin repeat domain-containing protein n=1 Tax=Priestia flexa TaxID=86664 RepID=A0ABU4JB84_9BACI|nr:ankyrin repeat domain-containing protein [Priestia flexa]MDW8518265.1 ankyrin repeat domain-containing protein [Priestia flexa]
MSFFRKLAEYADFAEAALSNDTENKLYRAILDEDTNRVIELLSKDIDWSRATLKAGRLILRLTFSKEKMFKALLDKGIPVNAKDNQNYTALFYAIYDNNYYAVDLLLKYGAKVSMRFGENQRNAITEAVILDRDPKIIKRLMESGANPNAADLQNNTAVSVATSQNKKLLPYLI